MRNGSTCEQDKKQVASLKAVIPFLLDVLEGT